MGSSLGRPGHCSGKSFLDSTKTCPSARGMKESQRLPLAKCSKTTVRGVRETFRAGKGGRGERVFLWGKTHRNSDAEEHGRAVSINERPRREGDSYPSQSFHTDPAQARRSDIHIQSRGIIGRVSHRQKPVAGGGAVLRGYWREKKRNQSYSDRKRS